MDYWQFIKIFKIIILNILTIYELRYILTKTKHIKQTYIIYIKLTSQLEVLKPE